MFVKSHTVIFNEMLLSPTLTLFFSNFLTCAN